MKDVGYKKSEKINQEDMSIDEKLLRKWFSDTINDWCENTFFLPFLKIIKGIKNLIIYFLIINLLILFGILIKNFSVRDKYPIATTCLEYSKLINSTIVLEIQILSGYKNTIFVLPFAALRDVFYNAGYNLLPKNSSEREIWWYKIKFMEYTDFWLKYFINIHSCIPISDSEKKSIEKVNNDVLEHIMSFKNTDFSKIEYKQPNYKASYAQKLSDIYSVITKSDDVISMYRNMIYIYAFNVSKYSLYSDLKSSDYRNGKLKKKLDYRPNFEAVKYNVQLLKDFDNFKEKIKNENAKEYELYSKNLAYEEYRMKKTLMEKFLMYQSKSGNINCSSEEYLIFDDMMQKMTVFLADNDNKEKIPKVLYSLYSSDIKTNLDTSYCKQ